MLFIKLDRLVKKSYPCWYLKTLLTVKPDWTIAIDANKINTMAVILRQQYTFEL